MADRRSLLPFRGQIRWPPVARSGDFDRTFAGLDQRASEPVEQPVLQRASREELGWVRYRGRYLFSAGDLLHRAFRLSALPQPVASDPLAPLDDFDLFGRMASQR